MPRLPTRIALLLPVAVAAMALSAGVGVADADTSQPGGTGDVSFAIRAARVDGLATRLTGDERRGLPNTERTLKDRLVLFAVLAGLARVALSAWRATAASRRCQRPVSSLWSPRAGRSPPPSSLSVV